MIRAWEELEKTVSLFWVGDEDNPTSRWYLDMGVKIERYEADGRIVIHDTMTNSEKYRLINDTQENYFTNHGWYVGCLKVNIDTIEERIDWLHHCMRYSDDKESIDRRIKKNTDKLLDYKQKLNKFV